MLFHSSRIWLAFYPDLESPESEKLTDSVSEKEEKDVDEKEEMEKESHFKQSQNNQPVIRRTKKREESKQFLPPGWEKHEVCETRIVKVKDHWKKQAQNVLCALKAFTLLMCCFVLIANDYWC